MNKKLNLLLLLSGVLFTLVGCESEDVTSTKIETPAFSGTLTNQFSTNSSVLNRNGSLPDLSSNTSHGISVSGQGSKMVEPDLALLNVGVEVFAETVTLARNTAAKSIEDIESSLFKNKVSQIDVQTNRFDISPRYDYEEITVNGRRIGSQILVGYTVTNSLKVKIRNLDKVGKIIDDASNAGGDFTRINSISFSVDDPSSHQSELRELAIQEALEKASHYADLTGIILGPVLLLSEAGSSVASSFENYGMRAMASAPYSTSITGGELELSLTVNVMFGIQ
tara:strand:+ start:505 stop:1347 length:843 start_codon:yes stop_codon:yes gene_type:complete